MTNQRKNAAKRQQANPVPKGFTVTESAMEKIRGRVPPAGVAMICKVTFIREATDEIPEPKWDVVVLTGEFTPNQFPEIGGVRFLFPDHTRGDMVGKALDFVPKQGFRLD